MLGGKRESFIAGLAFLMLFGIAVYFRLWAIDYNISSDDTQLLRRQFDLVNREAMDESAKWRLKYDNEIEKATKCFEQIQVENAVLLERMETLKRELEEEKLKCNAQ